MQTKMRLTTKGMSAVFVEFHTKVVVHHARCQATIVLSVACPIYFDLILLLTCATYTQFGANAPMSSTCTAYSSG